MTVHGWLKNLAAPRHGSRAHLALTVGGLVALAVLAIAFAMRPHHPAGPGVQAAATPPATAAPPTRLATAVPAAPAAATAPRMTTTTAPVAMLVPPAGLVAGQTRVTLALQDQYGQFAQSTSSVVASVASSWDSYTPPAGSPAWQQTFTGWFHLDAPASIAMLRRGAGSAAHEVSAKIDGTSLGAALGYGVGSETASIPLAAGWHAYEVDAVGESGNYQPPATAVQLLVGDGVNSPTTVTPYTVPAVPASAPRASAPTPAKVR